MNTRIRFWKMDGCDMLIGKQVVIYTKIFEFFVRIVTNCTTMKIRVGGSL